MNNNAPHIPKSAFDDAAKRIAPYVHRTPVVTSEQIDEIAGCQIFFKCENFQKMGAFKMRGAMNAILQLSNEQRKKGVVTHSSGNFAQAVALSAKLMNITAYIVMPTNAPAVKKAAVIGYGGEVIDCEPTLEARESTAKAVHKKTGATVLHPYNQITVIEGQGTAAMELLEDIKELSCLIAPVGGGGYASGTALVGNYQSTKIPTYGAEPVGADDAYQSLKSGVFVPQTNPQTIADGLRTSLGSNTFPILKENLTDIFTVEESEIIRAMHLVWERMKIVIEPSSAVPLAAILKHPDVFKGKRVGLLVSGGNVDLKKLPF